MKTRIFGLLATLSLVVVPAPVHAQEFIKHSLSEAIHKVGLHLNTSFREPTDPDVTKGTTFGASIGLSPGRENGWTYPVGLTMFSQDLHGPNTQPFGLVRTEAVMAGIGYGWHFGRLSTGATLQTGFARNRGRLEGDTMRAFDVPNDAVALHVSNSILLRPQLKAEYFLTSKFTVRASVDYMWMRPDVVVTTPTEQFTDRWNMSNAHANVGFGVYPFRR